MKRYILSVLCVLMTLSGAAQNTRVIKGKVLDIDGQSIAGATLRVMGSNEEIRSAEDGSFTFNVSPYAKELEASAFGYGPEVQEIDGSFMIFKLKVDKKAAQKAEAERAARIKAEQDAIAAAAAQERAKAEAQARAEEAAKAKAEAEARAKAEAEAKAAAEAEKARIAAEKAELAAAKAEETARKKAEQKAHQERLDEIWKNKGLTHSVEVSYGIQTGMNGRVLYVNSGYMDYSNLNPIDISYLVGYRFNHMFSANLGIGLVYNCSNLASNDVYYDDMTTGAFQQKDFIDTQVYEKKSHSRIDIPIFLNVKGFLGGEKIQPMVSASIGAYVMSGTLMYEIGAGCNFRVSKAGNVYVLASLKSTPWPYYTGPVDINDTAEPEFHGYKAAFTPGIRVGFMF